MALPFLKWVGGKRALATEVLARLPQRTSKYFEPFVGGGAIFFRMAEEKRFECAKISDANYELISTYRAIQNDIDDVITFLTQIDKVYKEKDQVGRETYYYNTRDNPFSVHNIIPTAGRMIFLNKTCYNGLYRVNKAGRFNSPFGAYKNPTICDEANLRAVHAVLQNVEITAQDFEPAIEDMRPGDVAYFDPPYWPVGKGSFTSYTDLGFDSDDQGRLAYVVRKIKKLGAYALVSNADVPSIRKLYDGLVQTTVYAPRKVNSNAKDRGTVAELLIQTKPVPVAVPNMGQ